MGKVQKKFEKRKARERAVQAKLLARRLAKNKKMRELREEAKDLEAMNKAVKQRVELEQWAEQVKDRIPEDVRQKLLHNIEILKALEEEYAQELRQKTELQAGLKEAGHESLPDMMKALSSEEGANFPDSTPDIVYSDSTELSQSTSLE